MDGAETVTVIAGAPITVTLALPEPVYEFVYELLIAWAAFVFTAYVPGGVSEGPVFVMVKEVLCPGLRITAVAEKLVDQPEGCVELKLKVLAEHPEESLLVIDRLYAASLPG